MARPRILPNELFKYDFEALAKKEQHARTRLRWLGMMQLSNDRSYDEIAASLGVKKPTVKDWIQRFKKEGLDGLRESPRSGAKRKLSTKQEVIFKEKVIELQEQREGGCITGLDVQRLLQDEFQVDCHLNSVYNYLHRVCLSWITVRSKHPKQDPEEQERFKKLSNSGIKLIT